MELFGIRKWESENRNVATSEREMLTMDFGK